MGNPRAMHEALEREEEVVGPSNRAFGLVMAAAFGTGWAIQLWRGGDARHWTLPVATLFLLTALVWPGVLSPLNRLWLRIGLVMHRVVNPVVMAGLFYLAVTPFGVIMRLLGKRLAPRLRPDPRAASYWVDRSGQPASRMDQQF